MGLSVSRRSLSTKCVVVRCKTNIFWVFSFLRKIFSLITFFFVCSGLHVYYENVQQQQKKNYKKKTTKKTWKKKTTEQNINKIDNSRTRRRRFLSEVILTPLNPTQGSETGKESI